VYESQDALIITYSATEQGYEGLCSIGVYPGEVKLFFAQGAQLSKSDPGKLLRGSGKTVRHVVLKKAADFDRAEIAALAHASGVSEARMLAANVLVDSQCSALVSPASEQQREIEGRFPEWLISRSEGHVRRRCRSALGRRRVRGAWHLA
jgi:hypothetical protein